MSGYIHRPIRTIRDDVFDAIDNGMIDLEYLLTACLKWMSTDDVREMLRANDISVRGEDEEEDEDDGQPSEAQEWHDFDPDC